MVSTFALRLLSTALKALKALASLICSKPDYLLLLTLITSRILENDCGIVRGTVNIALEAGSFLLKDA